MTEPTFDISFYVRTPTINIASGINLAEALLAACPKDVPTMVKKAHKKLNHVLTEAREAWAERQREEGQLSDEDRRVLDQEADNSWAGLRQRLLGYTLLPEDQYAESKRARELLTTLFGSSGLSFLTESYAVQSATMSTLLQRIEHDKLDREIDALCGPQFMKHLRDVIPRYQKMAQQMLRTNTSSSIDLRMHIRTLSSCIVQYATKVAALIDEDDPQTLLQVQQILRPIEVHRDQMNMRRAKPGSSKSEPHSPID